MHPEVNIDFIQNGQGNGSVASRMLREGFNTAIMRPYLDVVDSRGTMGTFITSNSLNPRTGKVEQQRLRINADATLRKDEWIAMDTAVTRVARERLKLVADLRSRGLTLFLRNGLGKSVLESQRVSDPGVARVSMEPSVIPDSDRPHFDRVGVPLPVISSGFKLGARQIEASRNSGEAIDTIMAEACSRRVAETAEQMATGTYGTFVYGGYTLAGIRNSTNRLTATITSPAATAWTPATIINEVLTMRNTLAVTYKHYGPFHIYVGPGWDRYLDADYSTVKGDGTLRERLLKIRGVAAIETLDHLSTYDFILVEMNSETIREIVGLDITTVQWEGLGGLEVNFLVMGILVPEIRQDKNGNTGIMHGAPA